MLGGSERAAPSTNKADSKERSAKFFILRASESRQKERKERLQLLDRASSSYVYDRVG